MSTLTQGEAFSLARRVVARRAEREANDERTQRLLDEDVAAMLDRLEAEIDHQRIDEWLESASARDYLPESEQ